MVEAGHKLILFTMRSDIDVVTSDDYGIHKKGGKYLTEAVNWFKENNIPLYGININPTQTHWTKSPKAYGQLYIDDAALGCPLTLDNDFSNRPFVAWNKVKEMLESKGLITKNK